MIEIENFAKDIINFGEELPEEKVTQINDVLVGDYNIRNKINEILLGSFSDFQKIIEDVEKNRNKIIKTVDELNYVVKNGFDVKFTDYTSTKAVLSAYTASDFYTTYDHCIDQIEKQSPKFYSRLNSTIDFKNVSSINNDQLKVIIAQILPKYEEEIYNKIVEILSNYTEEEKRKIRKQLKKFFDKNRVRRENLKISKLKKRKNDKKISYSISLEDLITTTDEIVKLFSTQNSVTNKLNFYRVI
jgi:ribosome-associated translation inhibitor RaiA